MTASNQTEDGLVRLRGEIMFPEGRVTLQGVGSEVVVNSPSPARSGYWWSVVPGALLLVGAFIAVRRLSPIHVETVELALLGGKLRRANRLASRMVRRHPEDPDVVFLYAASLLQRGNFAELIERVERLALGLRTGERRGVAYVLAVAARAVGKTKTSRRWAKEAAHDPLLGQRMRDDGFFPEITRRAAEPPPAGYA